MKILITGINGLLGSTLAIVLKNNNHKVCGLDADITSRVKVLEYKNNKFDYIIHSAAKTNVAYCENNPRECYAVNVIGTRNVRDLAHKTGARLIHISTASVFSGNEGNYKETEVPYPRNFYNISKVLAEEAVSEYAKGLILRINLIGIHPMKGSRGLNFFEWLINSIETNKDMNLFKDIFINPLSNWTLAELVEEIVKIKPKEKILHLGTRNRLSKARIGQIAIKHFKKYAGQIKIISSDKINAPIGPKQMWLNTDYAQKNLNLKMPGLESEIKKILNHYDLYLANKNR